MAGGSGRSWAYGCPQYAACDNGGAADAQLAVWRREMRNSLARSSYQQGDTAQAVSNIEVCDLPGDLPPDLAHECNLLVKGADIPGMGPGSGHGHGAWQLVATWMTPQWRHRAWCGRSELPEVRGWPADAHFHSFTCGTCVHAKRTHTSHNHRITDLDAAPIHAYKAGATAFFGK